MSSEKIKVLTLNCWGVFISWMTKKKDYRIDAICRTLKHSDYDIIFLQEIWTDTDYNKFVAELSNTFPYFIYFHNNVFGMGLCIFSRWRLYGIIAHPYNLNGYPHYVHQGEWASGKGIGFTKTITPSGFKLNLYVTHLHARYAMDHKKDLHESHRLCQAIELMEFIRATAAGADALIVGGDFNLEPYTVGMCLIKNSLGLRDAWLDQLARDPLLSIEEHELNGCTCERKDGAFSSDEWRQVTENGLRLDYLLFRSTGLVDISSDVIIDCVSCSLEMREIANSGGLQYSDHAGVAAIFTLKRTKPSLKDQTLQRCDDLFSDARLIVQRGMEFCSSARIQHLYYALLLMLLAVIAPNGLDTGSSQLATLMQTVCLLSIGAAIFCLMWGSLIGRAAERNAFRNIFNIIDLHLSQER